MNVISWKYPLRMGMTGALLAIIAYLLNISIFGLMCMGIAAFMVMDMRVAPSLRQGMNRILGTISGAILGVILASVFNYQSLLISMLCFSLIGVISALIYLREKSIRLMAMTAAIVYLLIIANPDHQEFAWRIGMNRAFDNTLAIITAMITSILIFPVSSAEEINQQAHQWVEALIGICKILGDRLNHQTVHDLAPMIKRAEQTQKMMQMRLEEMAIERDVVKTKLNSVLQWIPLSQVSYFIIHLSKSEITVTNTLINEHKTELFNCVKIIISCLEAHTQPKLLDDFLQQYHQALTILNMHFSEIRQQKMIARMPTQEVKNFYHWLTNFQLIYRAMQGIFHGQ